MQPVYIYMLTYIVPVFILIALATYVFNHNNRALENRLIVLTLLAFCVTLTGEFIRHVSPISYNPFITVYVIGFSTNFSMALIIHLELVLLKTHANIKIPKRLPLIGYLNIPMHIFITTFLVTLTTSDFHKSGIWIYRDNVIYNLWLYGVVGVMSSIAFFVCLFGWLASTNTHSKQLFRFLSIGTTIIFMSFLAAMLVLKVDNMIPNPTMFLIFLTGILFALGITKFELTPGIQARYQTMFDLTPTSIMLLDNELKILEINHQAKAFFYPTDEENVELFFDTPANVRQGLRIIKKLRTEKILRNFKAEFTHQITNEKVTMLINATVLPFQNIDHYYIMWQNITHEVAQEKLIHHLAFHDALTGIQNRAYFVNNVQQILHTKPLEQHALVLIDLNYFKQINDCYGHIVGDAVLQFTAKNLQALVESTGIVARLGGDEFVILFTNVQSTAQVESYLQNIRNYFDQTPVHYDDFKQTVSLSLGYSVYPKDGANFELLFNVADLNMYKNKAEIKSKTIKKV